MLNRVLRSRAARSANLDVSALAVAAMVANPPGDLDDAWFFAIEILAMLAIIGIAWTWRADPAERSLDPVITSET